MKLQSFLNRDSFLNQAFLNRDLTVLHDSTYYIYISSFFHFTGHCQTYQDYEKSQQKLGTFLENKVF